MRTNEYQNLVVNLLSNLAIAASIDKNSMSIHKLVNSYTFDSIKNMFKEIFTEKEDIFIGKILKDLHTDIDSHKIRTICLELMICRNVEVFDYYVVQILRKAFTERPQILKSSEYQVPMIEILQSNSIEEIVKRVSENKVQELSYKGLSDIIKYLNSHLKLGFDVSMHSYKYALELFQARNIIVHNAGIINSIYLQRTGRSDLKVGDIYPVNEDYFAQATANLINFGAKLDEKFVLHFKLSNDDLSSGFIPK